MNITTLNKYFDHCYSHLERIELHIDICYFFLCMLERSFMEKGNTYVSQQSFFVFISGLAVDLAKGREQTSRSEIRDNCAFWEVETLDLGFAEVVTEEVRVG